jgi:uncharacterized SAM-binding protein YcdF (DUF218 family)
MKTQVKRFVIFVGVVLVWVLLAAVAGNFLVVEVPIEKADAIVILSGSAEYRNRTVAAAKLWRQEVAPMILITDDGHRGGWDQSLQRNPTFSESIRRRLEGEGVPPERIVEVPGIADGTYEEASVIIQFLSEKEMRSILLVTSGFHTRRTLLAFRNMAERQNREISFGISCPDYDKKISAKTLWWLSLSGWRNIPAEAVKLTYYWLAY